MAKTVVDLDTLKINYLTQAQYNEAALNDEIEEDEIYLTPSSGTGVTDVEVNGSSVVAGGVADITVPTDTGDLTNNAGYITLADLPVYNGGVS